VAARFVVGGDHLATATIAVGLGIPDLNLPMYWGFIFLGFVFCPADSLGATSEK